MKNKFIYNNFEKLTISIVGDEWVCFDSNNKIHKNLILNHIEINSLNLRKKYVDFISNLNSIKIRGTPICDYFKVNDGYNLWWMSLIVEKSLYKSSQISDCIKLLALEDILILNKTKILIINGGGNDVINSIKIFSKNINIKTLFNSPNQNIKFFAKYFNPNFLKKKLPHLFNALFFYIKQYFNKNLYKRSSSRNFFDKKNSILFISYFIHLDLNKSKKGLFHSNQWGILPEFLKSNNIKSNWLHHFLKSDSSKSIEEGRKLISKFNKNSFQNHSFINDFSTFSNMLKIFIDFIKILFKTINISKIKTDFKVKNSHVNLWPLLKDDLLKSFRGSILIQNLIWIYQMDKIFKQIPHQKLAFYLMENQGWERAMIYAWNKYNHGKIIGIQHSVLRFWDLRYFDNFKLSKLKIQSLKPIPSLIALNNPFALKMILEAGYNKKNIIKLESLRYLSSFNNSEKKYFTNKKSNSKLNILIVGDINKDTNRSLIKLFSKINLKDFSLSIKFHPGALMDLNEFNNLNIKEIKSPLETILSDFNICISVGSTTAGLNAYILGLKVIVYLSKGEINLSPLRGFNEVDFVNDLNELSNAINGYNYLNNNSNKKQSYFWDDKSLYKWKSFLNL